MVEYGQYGRRDSRTSKVAVADVEDAKRMMGNEKEHPSSGKPDKPLLQRYTEFLETPCHSSTIAIFRMLYALSILAQLLKWTEMFEEFNASYVVFPYPGTGWVRPIGVEAGHVLLGVCATAAVMQLVGLCTIVATPVLWFTFSWLFHICESNHNNHYLLMCHLLFVGSFIGWGRWMSLDNLILSKLGRRRDPRVPQWHMLMMRLIFSVPYFYGAIAKMNPDWLGRAQPIIMWFHGRGGLYDWEPFCWAIAWSGMLFDLTISFLLWYRKTRYILAFPGALTFNFCNKIMFNIGVFPYMMMASLILFLEPHHPAQLVAFVLRRKEYGIPGSEEDAKEDIAGKALSPRRPPRGLEPRMAGLTAKQWWAFIFFTSFVVFHSLYPLRHFVLYSSNPSWTEEGHFGAWHMKLRSKRGTTLLKVEEMDGTIHTLDPQDDPFVNPRQRSKLAAKPHVLLLYVGRLKMVFDAAMRPLKSVTAMSCYALNDRPHHEFYIPTANLLDWVGKYELIGVTGVGKIIYRDAEGPQCGQKELTSYRQLSWTEMARPCRDVFAVTQSGRKVFNEIHSQAGIFKTTDPNTHRRAIKRKVAEGVFEDAYLWPMFE